CGSGAVRCRCSRCFCFPSKRRLRERPRVLPLLSVPEDAVLHAVPSGECRPLLQCAALFLPPGARSAGGNACVRGGVRRAKKTSAVGSYLLA
uniref:Uncharacterized protein n=1 Tax=Gallus gallus TaxID=9031 RepID=A0A8V0Z3L9_CHICK